ncbi:MAG TPA: glycoside hydrolase family 3 N-terminal domain-containing protein [Gemmatimonadales bacterium]|nr:glycoside hydrolase family 3 N-terminal domain-containing protein [Gemmatimonadales bacterium]
MRIGSVLRPVAAGALLATIAPALHAQARRPAVERQIDSILATMTLEEKLGQLNLLSVDRRASPQDLELVRQGRVGGFLNLHGAEAVREAQRVAIEESRLKIPLLLGLDVIHGYRTVFPIPLAEAGTWNPELAEAAARVAAREAAAAGVNWTFAPMVDLARDARWGRIAEGSGEDPYLGSVMAAARVRGFQGPGRDAPIGPDRLLATAKHFAAYGAAEAGRDYNTVDVSERTLREIYLPPFQAAVDAGVGSIMTAFNEIAGVPATGNAWLLKDVLRREWRFRGLVVSDWTSVGELVAHGVAGSRAEAGRLALQAGTDMDMVSRIYVDELAPLVRRGTVPLALVDSAVRRVLRVKFRLGLFRDPYRGVDPERERATLLAPEHRALAREAARQAIVLLKNEGGVLPLPAQGRTIAVIGPLAHDRLEPLGPWHTDGRREDVVTVLEGIRRRAASATVLHAGGAGVLDTATAGFAEAVETARRADVAVLVLGEKHDMSGEAASRAEIGLPGVQQQLLEAVAATGKPVVLLLMNGRPLALPWAAERVPAIVETWFLGTETGNAVADILFGDVSPSGKLPVSFPRAVGQAPIYYNHKNTGRPPSAERFTSKYLDVPVTPLWPFGHGLSYTTFAYSELEVSPARLGPRDTVRIRVRVRNTGSRDGTEVVQLYVRDEVATVTRPVRELKGFRRVPLAAGESAVVEFRLTRADLAFYGLDLRRRVEPGTFRVFVGPSSVEGLEGSFVVTP